MTKTKIIFSILAIMTAASLSSVSLEYWTERQGTVPYCFINFLFPETLLHTFEGNIAKSELGNHLIIVEKSDQHAALYRFQNGEIPEIELMNAYQISSGKADGNKLRRGDLKTPEGLYIAHPFFSEQNLRGRYGAIAAQYGTGAWELGYPNTLDRLRRKTGSGIWVHGTDVGTIPFDTEGCVRFENDVITYFNEELRFSKTPVIIGDVIEWVTIDFLLNEVQNIEIFLNNWLESWKRQDIIQYLSFYDQDDFVTHRQNMDFASWERHKRNIFQDSPVEIEMKDISYYYADNLLLISFTQNYYSTSVQNTGKKQLVLRRGRMGWRIVQEEFEI